MIGTRNESSLHASLKEYYYEPGDKIEEDVDGYIVDLVQDGKLVEIQTSNFSSIRVKLANLLEDYVVRVVYPIAAERQLVQIAPETGEVLSTRKSPRKGTIYDLFGELIRIPHLLAHPNLTIEAIFVVEQEIRCADGKGSWRRRGVSIVDRLLVEILERRVFSEPVHYLEVIPDDLSIPFTNKELAKACKIRQNQAQKVTYALRNAGFLENVGKSGNSILHERAVI